MDGGAGQRFIKGLNILTIPEHEVGGIVHLIEAPLISQPERHDDRAVEASEGVKFSMQLFHAPGVGQLLRARPVGDLQKCIIEELISDPVYGELTC